MTHTTYRITCDNCNRREHSQGDESEQEAKTEARAKGWEFRKVQNGSIWDLCPECSTREELE